MVPLHRFDSDLGKNLANQRAASIQKDISDKRIYLNFVTTG